MNGEKTVTKQADDQNPLEKIAAHLIFCRVKTESSLKHKLEVKYADKKVKIQDMIGIRIVTYFLDDGS